jgi:hypothetical protein
MSILEPTFQFTWDTEKTVDQNFTEWYTLNCEERSAFQEATLTRDEAVEIFEKMFNVSVDKS